MDTASQPLISVIMPVYNSEKYLQEAVASILNQTFADFELLVIDDGSTDESAAILETFRRKDTRLIVERHSQNQGLPAALNSGLALARGRYIARMDGDDISLPERFEKQIAFLEKYPGIDIVGSAVQLIDERGRTIGVLTTPFDDLAIHWASIFSASFIHPTIMLRHSVLIDHKIQYMASRKQPEDYVFFAQLLEYAHGANFTKPLLLYRIHPASVTSHSGRDNINRKSILIYTNLKKHFPALAISHDQVLNVSGALLGRPPMFWKRAQAADTYLRVWQVFSERCNPDPAFYRLRTNVVLIAAKLALYPPFQPGSQKVIRRIFEIEPKWFPSFLRKFPGMVSTKIQTILIRHNRK